MLSRAQRIAPSSKNVAKRLNYQNESEHNKDTLETSYFGPMILPDLLIAFSSTSFDRLAATSPRDYMGAVLWGGRPTTLTVPEPRSRVVD